MLAVQAAELSLHPREARCPAPCTLLTQSQRLWNVSQGRMERRDSGCVVRSLGRMEGLDACPTVCVRDAET